MQAHATTLPLTAQVPQGKPKTVKMAAKLAYRNLFHDRLSLIVTLIGIVFSVVLVAVQCGLYIGSERMIAAMLDQAKGDLWVVPLGTKSFDDPSLLIGHEKYSVLSTPGVADAEELVVGFAAWRKPKGGTTAVLLVGSDHKNGTLKPWNIVAGSLGDLDAPLAVAVDDTYFADLGVDEDRRDRGDQRRAREHCRRHPRHPLLHDAALRLHLAEAGAHAASMPAPTRPPTPSCASRPDADLGTGARPISSPACRIARC